MVCIHARKKSRICLSLSLYIYGSFSFATVVEIIEETVGTQRFIIVDVISKVHLGPLKGIFYCIVNEGLLWGLQSDSVVIFHV